MRTFQFFEKLTVAATVVIGPSRMSDADTRASSELDTTDDIPVYGDLSQADTIQLQLTNTGGSTTFQIRGYLNPVMGFAPIPDPYTGAAIPDFVVAATSAIVFIKGPLGRLRITTSAHSGTAHIFGLVHDR